MKRFGLIGALTLLLMVWLAFTGLLAEHLQNISMVKAQTDEEDTMPEPDPELIELGRDIFEFSAGGVGCASCHARFALGDNGVGPNLRGASEDRIRGGLEQISAMAFLLDRVTDDDITAIAAYLQYLDTLLPAKSVRSKGVFEPLELRVPTATQVQLIVENGDRTPCTFSSPDGIFEDKPVNRRSSEDILWTTPDEPATFSAACTENPGNSLTLIVEQASEDADDGGSE